jgi:hypothetical protein
MPGPNLDSVGASVIVRGVPSLGRLTIEPGLIRVGLGPLLSRFAHAKEITQDSGKVIFLKVAMPFRPIGPMILVRSESGSAFAGPTSLRSQTVLDALEGAGFEIDAQRVPFLVGLYRPWLWHYARREGWIS